MTNAEKSKSVRWYLRQMWRDLLSIYYANTPVWRWLKSGALVFLGFFLWMGGNILLSVKPGWTVLHYAMAYGFLLVFWGPFTHFVVVPLTIRLRRTAERPLVRKFSRNTGKINLTIFFILVAIFGTVLPGVMMLEFSPAPGDEASADVSGEVVCDVNDLISCHVEDPSGFDHVVVTSGGTVVATAEEPPYEFEIHRDDLTETRTGKEFQVDFRDQDDTTLRRHVRSVPTESSD